MGEKYESLRSFIMNSANWKQGGRGEKGPIHKYGHT